MEWADYAAVQAECGNLSGNELTRDSSGNTWSQSSQLAEPLWTDPGLKKGIYVRELTYTKKQKTKKQPQAGNEFSNILPKSSYARKRPPPSLIVSADRGPCTGASQCGVGLTLSADMSESV